MTIGIIPAAGSATRMMGLPKMLLPIPDEQFLFHRLCTMLKAAGARQLLVGTTSKTYELLTPLAPEGCVFYRVNTKTMSETVLLARDYMDEQENVIFGMPDTYFEHDLVFETLLTQMEQGADAAAALFHTRPEQRNKLGMCSAQNGVLLKVVDKPAETDLEWAWGALAWKSTFWQYIRVEDPHVGYALPRALEAGLYVRGIHMPGQYFDCGTSAEYFVLIRHLTGERVEA
jgi:glucose-1-phosphate thymidylyltransferase